MNHHHHHQTAETAQNSEGSWSPLMIGPESSITNTPISQEAVRIYGIRVMAAVRRQASGDDALMAEGARVMADEDRRIAAEFRSLSAKTLPAE